VNPLERPFELSCADFPSEDVVIDSVIPRKFSPKLIEMVNKYGLIKPLDERLTRLWYIEEDGARVLFEYINTDQPVEGYVVDIIYNFRDLYISRKISLNTLRRWLANVATYIMHRNATLFADIVDLLKILGCQVTVEMEKLVTTVPSDDMLIKALEALRYTLSAQHGVVSVKLKVISRLFKKPLPSKVIYARYVVPTGGSTATYTITAETDKTGEAKIAVPKLSILYVRPVGAREERKIIVGDKEIAETLQVLDFKADLLPLLAIIGLAGTLIATVLLLAL
jgi:hypothetical protein